MQIDKVFHADDRYIVALQQNCCVRGAFVL